MGANLSEKATRAFDGVADFCEIRDVYVDFYDQKLATCTFIKWAYSLVPNKALSELFDSDLKG